MFGRFQKTILCYVSIIACFGGLVAYANIFNNASPKFICEFKQGQNKSSNMTNSKTACEISNTDLDWECRFDTKHFDVSIVTEWGLICDEAYKSHLTQTVYMIGSFCSIVCGYLSDRFGRRKLLQILSVILCVNLIFSEVYQLERFALSIQTRYSIFLLIQFVSGFAAYAIFEVCFVLLIELTSKQYHTFVAITNQYMFVVGQLLSLLINYAFRNWHIQNHFIIVLSVLSAAICFVLPESPAFLLVKQRYTAAASTLNRIAKSNKAACVIDASYLRQLTAAQQLTQTCSNENNVAFVCFYLLNPKRNLFYLLLLLYVCIAFTMLYTGVSLGIIRSLFVMTCLILFFWLLKKMFSNDFESLV